MKYLILILLCPVMLYGQLSQKTIATDTLKGRTGGKMVFRDTAKFNWLTSGSVPWIGSDKTLRQDNTNFKWDSTNKALTAGAVILNKSNTAKLTIDGTDASISSGEVGLSENGGESFWFSRHSDHVILDDDNNSSIASFDVKDHSASGNTLFSIPETTTAFVRASTGYRASRQRAFDFYNSSGRWLSGIVSDSNFTGAYTALGWKVPFYGNAVSEGGMWSDEDYMLSGYQQYDTTSLASAASGNDTTITVLAVPSGFGNDRNVMIGTLGTDMDVVQVWKIVGTTYYLNQALLHSHAAGSIVYPYRWRGAIFPVSNWWTPNGKLNLGADLTSTEASTYRQHFGLVHQVAYDNHLGSIYTPFVLWGGTVSATAPASMGISVAEGMGLWGANGSVGTSFHAYTQTSVTIAIADPSNARNDVVYWDTVGVARVVAGVADGSLAIPSVPTGGTKLAVVAVGAGVTSISSGNITDSRQLSPVVSSVTITDQRRNFDVVSTSGTRDTSSSFFSFDANSKPLFNINGKDGNQILGVDSVGALTIGQDASAVNPRRAQASLVLTPPYPSTGREVEIIMMPTASKTAALRAYVAPSGTSTGLTAPTGSVSASTNLLSMSAGGYDSSAWGIGSNINLTVGNKWTTTSHPSYMTFNVNPTGSTTRSEVMRIDTSLNVGIGDITPLYKLTVGNGDLFGVNSSGQGAKINNMTVEGDGFLGTPDTLNWTGMSASVSAVNFSNTATGHLYEFVGTLMTTTAGTSGTVSVTISYNDGAAQTYTSSNLTFGTLGADVNLQKTFYVNSGTPTIATTVTSPVGSPVYAVRGALKRIW